MTRKRAKKMLMRYRLDRNLAEMVLKNKIDSSNAEVVDCFRKNYIATVADALVCLELAKPEYSMEISEIVVAANLI